MGSVLSVSSTERLRVYFSGGAVAFAFPFILLELIGFITGPSPATEAFQRTFQNLIIILNFVGGMTGGFLAARVSPVDKVQTGAVTGVSAYLIQQVAYFFYYSGNAPQGTFVTISLIAGSIIGSYFFNLYMRQKSVKQPSIKPYDKE